MYFSKTRCLGNITFKLLGRTETRLYGENNQFGTTASNVGAGLCARPNSLCGNMP